MVAVAQHYADHLAPIYVWMAGGLEHAFGQGASDLAALVGPAHYAVDLGAGFGMHAIPLARSGARVLAIDSSPHLLASLASSAQGLPIDVIEGDLLSFASHLQVAPDRVLCLGDTLTHLPEVADVQRLLRSVAAALAAGGAFIATFRDYRELPQGDRRFIPVRSDADRIHTCMLEALPQHVRVHDLIHERHGAQWQQRVSSYLKLRLDPDTLLRWAAEAGLHGTLQPGPRGMLALRAEARG